MSQWDYNDWGDQYSQYNASTAQGNNQYYNQAQTIDINQNYVQPPTPLAQYYQATAPTPPASRPVSTSGYHAGAVEGLDQGQWVNRDSATHCALCEAPFSTLSKRRHNCRVCGQVFCGNCSSDKLNVAHKGIERACFLCYSAHASLTIEEQKIIAEVCQDLGEYAQMQTMVFRKKDSGQSNRHHAMIIVSRYNIICLRRAAPRASASMKLSLLDLGRISIPKYGMLVLEFGKQTGVPLVEQYNTAKAPELLLTIRTQHASICAGMPSHCQLVVDAPPEFLLPMSEGPKIGVAGGFIESYRSWCNFYHQEASEELVQYVTDSVERTPYVLDLSYCPGIEPGTNISFDLKPVFQALRYNSYFLGLRLCDVVAHGAMELLVPCLKQNRVLTQLHLRNLTTTHLTLIGTALAENGPNTIQDFDFSGTKLSEKAARSLALSLVTKEYGLRSMKLAGCQLNARSMGVIIREGFLPSPEVTVMTEELDISDNRMDEEGSLLLQVWMSKMGKRASLKRLNVSKSNCLLSAIIPAIEITFTLEELNVSHCPMDAETATILASALSNLEHFKSLNVSHCGLTGQSLGLIIGSTVRNPNLSELKIIAGGNHVDDASAYSIISALNQRMNLHTLDLSQMRLGEKSILDLFTVITNYAVSLKTLILADFFGAITNQIQGARIGHALADLILQVPSIDFLEISKSKLSMFKSASSTGVVLFPFIQRMQRNETLLDLNVKGNRLGDKMAIALADMLRCNTTLLSLNCDSNRITLTGFQSLEYALHRNRTLQRFIFPTLDVRRYQKSNATVEKQNVLFQILSNIQLAVYFNQHKNGKHEYIQDEHPFVPPSVGAMLTYNDQAAPPSSHNPAVVAETKPWGAEPEVYQAKGEYLVSQTPYTPMATPVPGLGGTPHRTAPPPPVATSWGSGSSVAATPTNDHYGTSPVSSSSGWGSMRSTPAVSSSSNTLLFDTQPTATQDQGDSRQNDLFSALASVLAADSEQNTVHSNMYDDSNW